jgi:hypothetical protein
VACTSESACPYRSWVRASLRVTTARSARGPSSATPDGVDGADTDTVATGAADPDSTVAPDSMAAAIMGAVISLVDITAEAIGAAALARTVRVDIARADAGDSQLRPALAQLGTGAFPISSRHRVAC